MFLKKMNELVGKTINYWTVLEARPNKQKGMVLAQCICGKRVIIRGRSISTQISKSCGCRRKEYTRKGKRIEGSKPALKKCFSQYRTKATNQDIEFQIDINTFEVITSKECYYCDKPPSNRYKTNTDIYTYNGIDRVDNTKGYIINNIVACCKDCNTIKGSISKEMIITLYKWYQSHE